MDTYDIEWKQDALGLRFTPNDHDLPVICQIPNSACEAVLQSRAAVGDILIAFRPHGDGKALENVDSFDQLVTVLRNAELPVTLRFQSREKDLPLRIPAAEIMKTYEFTWLEGVPLGVSLAMDPCTLHGAITGIDSNKISPAFHQLKPAVGDVLVKISGKEKSVQLDELRFEEVIQTLRQFPRPCELMFARLEQDEEAEEDVKPLPSVATRPHSTSNGVLPFLRRQQPGQGQAPQRARPRPLTQRMSFRIDKAKSQESVSERRYSKQDDHAINSAKKESGFYTVAYAGGSIGVHLRDCTADNKSGDKNKTNGYAVAIKEVTDPRSAQGLDQASPDDLLMAIGQRDLQHMPFEQVRQELSNIYSPTMLLFKKRQRSGAGAGNVSLVDALMLFLV